MALSLAVWNWQMPGWPEFVCDDQGLLNERQEKVLLRIFREGEDGFTGGLEVVFVARP
jgi:hypothetical protein